MKTFMLLGMSLFWSITGLGQMDIQGHRGCRGHLPENSIQGMIKAIEFGATTLELDVVISADQKVIVSHEPWMAHDLCLKPDGSPISKQESRMLNIFQMTSDSIQKYNCGQVYKSAFPQQQLMDAYKPTLGELIDAVEKYLKAHKRQKVRYNIELKSNPEWDGFYQPEPELFCRLVLAEIKSRLPFNRVTVQSFDSRILNQMKVLASDLSMSFLVEDAADGQIETYLAQLNFKPQTLSPHYSLVSEELIERAKSLEVQVIPWTVNREEDMLRLIKMGVDGIISDYPDRVVMVLQMLNDE